MLLNQDFPEREMKRRCTAMRSFKISVFILVLHFLEGALTSSLVKLINNGYEGIVIAIDPKVPEDEKLIHHIQTMVKQASPYLFEATERRFYFKNVAILIPETWRKKPEYMRPKLETYKNADILVSQPNSPNNDEPYTEQMGNCGERGERIRLTADFLKGKKLNEYGPQGRALVREWAQLRWGVFNEYNNEQKFYLSQGKIKPVVCPEGITGRTGVMECKGSNCIAKQCKVDKLTRLYEKNCEFIPEELQVAQGSITYLQTIDSAVHFCTHKNHNRYAPNLQNQKCNLRSAWEVIQDSEDFKRSKPMRTKPPKPSFSLLQRGHRTVVLVVDKSGSMNNGHRLQRMNQAGKLFLLHTVELGSWVGIVTFDSAAYVRSELIKISNCNDRIKLTRTLPSVASGRTSICAGLRSAFTMIKKRCPTDGAEIVLLTDGEDSTLSECFDEVKASGTIIHIIALEYTAEKDLEKLSKMTGGLQTYATDQVQNNGLMDAFEAFSSSSGDFSQHSIQLESKGLIFKNAQWMNGTLVIDKTVGKETLFAFTWTTDVPRILLWDPSGKIPEGIWVDKRTKSAFLQIPGTAKAGLWKYSLRASFQTLTLTVTSRASSVTLPPLTVTSKVNKVTCKYPNPMVVYAKVYHGDTPILKARVTALIESNSGKLVTLELLDNGAGADTTKDDGIYSRYFTAYEENGRFNVKVRVNGGRNTVKQNKIHLQNRGMYPPGQIKNGKIRWNPRRPAINNVDQRPIKVCFSRVSNGGSFVISNVPKRPLRDVFPPSKIIDLEAKLQANGFIRLTWTAPGDDYDNGKVSKYIIGICANIDVLRNEFNDAYHVDTTRLIPKEANSKEVFMFKPKKLPQSDMEFFIAIQAVDDVNLKSAISNIARVSLFAPQSKCNSRDIFSPYS